MNDETPVSSIVAALPIREDAARAFLSWQARIASAAAAMAGFLSIEFIPVSGFPHEWQMVLQFRDAQSLADWRASSPRNRLHEEVRTLLDHAAELNERPHPIFTRKAASPR